MLLELARALAGAAARQDARVRLHRRRRRRTARVRAASPTTTRTRPRSTRCWCWTTSRPRLTRRGPSSCPGRCAAAEGRCSCCARPRPRSSARSARAPAAESSAGQFLRQAWPLTLREQGPLVAAGHRRRHADGARRGPAARPRLRARSTLTPAAGRLRQGGAGDACSRSTPPPRSRAHRPSYLVFGRKLVPGWAVALLALALAAPVHGRGRSTGSRAPAAEAARWCAGRAGRWRPSSPFLVVLAAAWLFELLGLVARDRIEALAPATRPSFSESAPALVALVLLFALCLAGCCGRVWQPSRHGPEQARRSRGGRRAVAGAVGGAARCSGPATRSPRC